MRAAKDIGTNLQNLRTARGLSRKELAKAIGASESAVAMYEHGERIPRDEMKVRIARFFDQSIEFLFFAN
jgi:transcriptional regulator with XRE-family HTH domain